MTLFWYILYVQVKSENIVHQSWLIHPFGFQLFLFRSLTKWFSVGKVIQRGHTTVIYYNPLSDSWVNLIIFDDMIMKWTLWLRLTNTCKCETLQAFMTAYLTASTPHLNKLKAHYANGDSGAKHSKCLVSPTCKNPMIKKLHINGS